MNVDYKIHKVSTLPHEQHQNFISTVDWTIVFSDGIYTSEARLITTLPLTEVEEFVPIEKVSKEQLLTWCINNEGGAEFLSQITEMHRRHIDFLKRQDQAEEYTGNLLFELSPQKPMSNEVVL